ncbi:MAG: hypothetical protein ACXAC5_20215 [Promethearchaeota archaeon]|jgi:energy-converting hydrogenase Eha subunit H
MMDSELNKLRKRKIKRILVGICGIAAMGAIITIFIIMGLANSQSSGGG